MTTTTAKVPAAAPWSLESGQTIAAKATLTPASTNWTNYFAEGAALKLGFAGLGTAAQAALTNGSPTAPAAVAAAAATAKISNPQWIKSVNFAAAGYKDLSKDPAAAANSWYSKNQAALTGASLAKYKVGPWFAHLEVNLGKNAFFSSTGVLKNIYTAEGCQTGSATGLYYAPGHVPAATTEVCPALNSWGDYWSVTVRNTTAGATAQPDTIVHGNRVTKAAVLTSGSYAVHTHATTTAYFANSLPSVATDLKDLASSKLVGTKNDTDLTYTAGVMSAPTTLGTTETLGTESVCDTTKWADATACHGVTTWKQVSGTEPSDTADGKFVFIHWLGDNLTTRDIFSIEAKDTYSFVVHEHRAIVGGYPVGSSINANAFPDGFGSDTSHTNKGVVGVAQDYWGVSSSYAVGEKIGATSTVLGAAALLSVLSFF